MTAELEVTRQDRILWIRFNRPAKKNALTIDMYKAAIAALGEASADPAVRAVVFAGHPGAFTSGNDLNDFMMRQSELGTVLQFLDAIAKFEKPLLAAVDGMAIGIGTTLLLHCDAAWATARSAFKTPFVDLGLVPEAGSSLLLAQYVGVRTANEMLMFGRALDGDEACRRGLVNAIVEPEALEAAVAAKAAELADKAPQAIRSTKALIRAAQGEALALTMKSEAQAFAGRLTSPEFMEAAGSFLQKRKPDFSKFA